MNSIYIFYITTTEFDIKTDEKNGFLINPRILRILSFQSSQLEGPFISITMFFEIIPFPRPVFVDFKQFWKWPNFFRLNFSFQIPLFHKCNKETLTKLFKQKNSSSSQTGINIEWKIFEVSTKV